MIRYNLRCRKDHHFEAWFRDSKLCDEQLAAGEVPCAVCGSKKVEKALMAPRVVGGKGRGKAAAPPAQVPAKTLQDAEKAGKVRAALKELRNQVESNCDYVGPAFAEEARKIHYGESEARGIYGETSEKEAEALKDEGVAVQSVPWIPKDDA